MASAISQFVNVQKLKTTKASAGQYAYYTEPGEWLVQIQSAVFGFKTTPSGNRGAAYLAIENKNLVANTTSTLPHLQVGRTASMFAEDEGNLSKVYLPKIKNAAETILNVSSAAVEAMTEEQFSTMLDGLFFDSPQVDAAGKPVLDANGRQVVHPALAVGEIVCIKAAGSKNQAKEDRCYSTYHVAPAELLAQAGLERKADGTVGPKAQ